MMNNKKHYEASHKIIGSGLKYLLLASFLLFTPTIFAMDFVQWYKPSNSIFDVQLTHKIYPKLNLAQLLKKRSKVNVSSLSELKKALDIFSNQPGEHVIILRKNIANKSFHYKQTKHRASRIYVIGLLKDNKPAYFYNKVTWENIANITFSHIQLSRQNAKKDKYIWQIRNSNNIRLSNMKFYGVNKGIKGALNNPRGLLITKSKNILIDRSLFKDLFHAVEFRYLENFFAIANKADRISGDMFSGGGTSNALFDSNLSFTKLPTKGIHSDMIQLHTSNMTCPNHNITIQNNVSIPGYSPTNDPRLEGWQCFFTRDENKYNRKQKEPFFSNIRIHNNICVSNQHHGVTLSQGKNSIVSNNLILEIGKRNNPNITAGIRVKESSNTKVIDNASKRFFAKNNQNTRDNGNHIFNGLYYYVKALITQRRTIAPSRRTIKQTNNHEILNRVKINAKKPLKSPIDRLDFNMLGIVPF